MMDLFEMKMAAQRVPQLEAELAKERERVKELEVKRDVAVATIELLKVKCDVRGRALAGQAAETKQLREQLEQQAETRKLALDAAVSSSCVLAAERDRLAELCRDAACQVETDADIIKSSGKEIHFLRERLSAAQEKVATLQEDLDLGITRDANLHYYREQLACAQAKVRELAHQKGALIDKADTYYQKLAAAQATIAEMREAVMPFLQHRKELIADSWFSEKIFNRVSDVLPTTTNQDALHEALARECERLADAEGVEEGHREWLREEAAAHRVRKEGK